MSERTKTALICAVITLLILTGYYFFLDKKADGLSKVEDARLFGISQGKEQMTTSIEYYINRDGKVYIGDLVLQEKPKEEKEQE